MATKTKAGEVTLTIKQGAPVEKLLILGRGQLHKRRLHAVRLLHETMERLRAVASGPDYLLIELAVREFCERLEAREDIRIVKAEDLG